MLDFCFDLNDAMLVELKELFGDLVARMSMLQLFLVYFLQLVVEKLINDVAWIVHVLLFINLQLTALVLDALDDFTGIQRLLFLLFVGFKLLFPLLC